MDLTINEALQKAIHEQKIGNLADAEKFYRFFLNSKIIETDYPLVYMNFGVLLADLRNLDESEKFLKKAIDIRPDFAEAHFNLGNTLKLQGKLDEAVLSFKDSIKFKSNYSDGYNNLGTTLLDKACVEEAEIYFQKAIKLNPNNTNTCWNLSIISKNIIEAEYWIDRIIQSDSQHIKSKLIKSILRFYQGDKSFFDIIMQSNLKDHYYMRSFLWISSLETLPKLFFSRWSFYDEVLRYSNISRPFYEFGVWRGESFKYFIEYFNTGYGFDTFEGLPNDWYRSDGSIMEKSGTYSANNNIPNIKGGEFIVGNFDDTLPKFFSEPRPIASIVNYDADLYSSTICALNYSKPVIDKDTILIFDELIAYEGWENDEFKALKEFTDKNNLKYEVLAVSFFTKQVAIKLIL
jgi:Tfp pilus assembly protein PilF